MIVRAAAASDYATFVALFPELAVDDPILPEARFVAEILPCMLVAEDARDAVGYVYFQIKPGEEAYVRHLVTAPRARRMGIAAALMRAVAARGQGARCPTWCLNVKRDNAAAIALYEKLGMRQAHESVALVLEPDTLASLPRNPALIVATTPDGSRMRVAVRDGETLVGEGTFDPRFPGVGPFRVAQPESAGAVLATMCAHAAGAPRFYVFVEEQKPVVDALLALGARVRFELLHMRGPLPG